MKTIFNYDPTDAELVELFGYDAQGMTLTAGTSVFPKPVAEYNNISDEEKLLDIAQLLELRGQKAAAAELWGQIPDLHFQWRCGFDYQMIATK